MPRPVAGKIVGNKLIVNNSVTIPVNYGASNRRLIMQPYIMDCTTEDIVNYMPPVVMDGPEYGLTQDRRMAYDIKNDKLAPYINTRRQLDATRFNLDINDSVPVPDPPAHIQRFIQSDYCRLHPPTYEAEWKMTTCKNKTPFAVSGVFISRFRTGSRQIQRNTLGANEEIQQETSH